MAQNAAAFDSRFGQVVLDQTAHPFVQQIVFQRNVKRAFHGRCRCLAHAPRQQVAQQEFGGLAPHLGAFRKRGEQLHEFMVEKGHAVFHRVRHAQSILFQVDVGGQPFAVLNGQDLVRDRAPRGFAGEGLKTLAAETGQELGRVELGQFGRPVQCQQQVVAVLHRRARQSLQQQRESFAGFAADIERDARQPVDEVDGQRTRDCRAHHADQSPRHPGGPLFHLDDGAQVLIAAKRFVGAIASQHDFDARIACCPRQDVLRHDDCITDRFFKRRNDLGHAQHIVGAAKDSGVPAPQQPGGGLRARGFVRTAFKVDTEGAHGMVRQARHLADQYGGINAATEVRPDFDIGNHVAFDGRGESVVEQGLVRALVVLSRSVVRRLVIGVQRRHTVLPRQIGAGGQPVHTFEDGLVGMCETCAQIEIDGGRVRHHGMATFEDRANLGCEVAGAATEAVIAGLDAVAVAHKKECPVAAVVERKHKHATQSRQHVHAVFLIQVDQRLGVGLGLEYMTLGDQFCREFAVVVDLAVEDDRD